MRFAQRLCVASLSALLVAGQDWTQWPQCTSTTIDPVREPQSNELTRAETYETYNQIVFVDKDTGKITVNDQATVWEVLKTVDSPVHVITVFGGSRSGKSTMASMLSAAMGHRRTTFPSYTATDSPSTHGIWSSGVFSYPEGEANSKLYMILDIMPYDNFGAPYGSLTYTLMSHLAYKMIAMLSEISSVFVHVWKEQSTNNVMALGASLKTTRENLIIRSAQQGGVEDPSSEIKLRSENEPAMVIASRWTPTSDLVLANDLAPDQAMFSTQASTYFDFIVGDDAAYGDLLLANYHNVENGGRNIPWQFVGFPSVQDQILPNFDWGTTDPYPWEHDGFVWGGAAAEVYDNMGNAYCRRTSGSGPAGGPAGGAVYKTSIDYLAMNVIHATAPTRRLSISDDETPVDLIGSRLREYLQVGIDEMNNVGPLPRTELWRIIMQDRCKAELRTFINRTYGEDEGEIYNETIAVGKCKQIQNFIDSGEIFNVPPDQPNQARALQAEQAALWNNGDGLEEDMDKWFASHELMSSVKDTCTETGREYMNIALVEVYGRLNEEIEAQIQTKARLDAEARLALLQKEIDRMKWWNTYRPYMVGGLLALLVVCYFCSPLFATLAGSCKMCAFCCGAKAAGGELPIKQIIVQQQGQGLTN